MANSGLPQARRRSQRETIPYICDLGAKVGCKRLSEWCASRQVDKLKKYKIFVLPDIQPGNIFMPPIVAFHEIPLVLRLQALSVAGRLYSNLYIL